MLIFGTFWEPHKLFLVHGQGRALPWGSSQEVEMNANCEGLAYRAGGMSPTHIAGNGYL